MRVKLNSEQRYDGTRHSPGSTIDVREDVAAAWVMRGYADYVDDATIGTARITDDVVLDDDSGEDEQLAAETEREAPADDAVLSSFPDAPADDLESLNVAALTERAKALGIPTSDKRKAELIEAIRDAEAQ